MYCHQGISLESGCGAEFEKESRGNRRVSGLAQETPGAVTILVFGSENVLPGHIDAVT